MHEFEYVPKKEYMPVKKQLIELIHKVQDGAEKEIHSAKKQQFGS